MSYLYSAVSSAAASDPLVETGAGEILVKLGEPSRNNPPDVISFGSVNRRIRWESFIGSGGTDSLYELYDIDVQIHSWLAYGDVSDDSTVALQVIQRAWLLESYVESAVRADPSFGGLVDIAYPSASNSNSPEWSGDPTGLLVSISLPIHVEATI